MLTYLERRRAAVVSQALFGSANRVIMVLISSQDAVELGTSRVVVTRQDHVSDILGHIAHPLLPKILVGLVQNAHVTTLRCTLVGDLALEQWLLVLRRDVPTGEGSAGAIVADGPVVGAGHNPRVPVNCVSDVTAVPGNGGALVRSLGQVLVGALGVSVAHVVSTATESSLGSSARWAVLKLSTLD